MKHLCFGLFICLLGIEYSYGWVNNMNEMQNQCRMEGGFCINTHLPRPVRPPRRRMRKQRRRGPKTRTRKGQRPAARGRGGAASAAGAAGAGQGTGAQAPAGGVPYQAQRTWNQPAWQPQQHQQQPQQHQQQQQQHSGGLFSGFNPMWMFLSTRKKRQAQAEPMEPGEGPPRRQRGQDIWAYLSQHCLQTEFDFGCQKEGGICCTPKPV